MSLFIGIIRPMEKITLDPQRQEQARAYARISRRLILVDLALGGVYILAWLIFGWSISLRERLLALTHNDWLVVAGFGAVFGALYTLVNLPLSFYEGFVLPHRFQQSTQPLKGWVIDQLKGLLMGVVIGGLVLEIIYAILRAAPQTWWLWASGFLLLFNVVLASVAPVLLFPLFYKFVPLGEEHNSLAQRLVELGERAGTRVQGVYKFDMSRRTKAANAALTGLGRTRRIILGDTLLNEFTPDEIETVMAHELGHQANGDISLGILISTMMTVGGLWLASIGLRWGIGQFGFSNPADIAALPLFILVMGLFGLVTMPLNNAYSRWRERLADRFALRLTGKGVSFASALKRLANQNLAEADPERWVEILLYSHPALGRRIAMAEANQEK
jgi:STE24 endopeptidase